MVKHLACMMDGNRRWARKQGWAAVYGHRHGIETVKKVVEFCLEQGISYLSLYTFSIENLKRSEEEKSSIFSLALNQADSIFQEFINLKVRVRFIGDRSLFPAALIPTIEDIEKKTADCNLLQLNFLFCYGSRQEIVGGVKEIVRKIQAGELQESAISEQLLSQHFWLGDIPEPDLVIRTGGAQRLSNFLLFQSAYSEYFFLDCFWPDLTKADLEKVMQEFAQRQRNFGT